MAPNALQMTAWILLQSVFYFASTFLKNISPPLPPPLGYTQALTNAAKLVVSLGFYLLHSLSRARSRMMSSMDTQPQHTCDASATPAPTATSKAVPEENEKKNLLRANPDECSPVVLVVHASVGSGHKLAAQAIAQAFEDLEGIEGAPENLQVEVVDILDYGRIRFNGDHWAHLFTGVTRPWYDFVWRYLFTGRLLWGGGWSWARIMFPRYTEMIRKKKPLAVICTHITAANATVGARMATGQNFPLVCVPTDYETEGWWPHRAADLFCVGTESMAETLRPRKVEEERIAITGIPTRLDFSQEYDRTETRAIHDLPQDKTVVLALAGSTMASPYVLFRGILDQILPYMHTMPNVHLLFCAGNDENYRNHLTRQIEDLRLENVSVIGFTDQMAALMSCCDAVLCKPGGLVTTEALCTKTPLILLGRAYGQEFINVRMLTSRGAALHVTTGRELLEVLRLFHQQPTRAQSLLINANTLRKPNAARDIASRTMDLALGRVPMFRATRKHYFAHFYWGKKPAHTR